MENSTSEAYTSIIHFLQESIKRLQKAKKDYLIIKTRELKQAQTEILVALTILSKSINKERVTKKCFTKSTRVSHAYF